MHLFVDGATQELCKGEIRTPEFYYKLIIGLLYCAIKVSTYDKRTKVQKPKPFNATQFFTLIRSLHKLKSIF